MEPRRRRLALRESHSFPRHVIDQIHGWRRRALRDPGVGGQAGAAHVRRPGLRHRLRVPVSDRGLPRDVLDDDGARLRYASKPLVLDIPITIAGMSFGALSGQAKEALGRAATAVGTSTTTGDGGMTTEEREASKYLVYQCLPSRYGFNPRDVHRADAIEIVIGQGAKPGGGGMLLGQKVSERVAGMRTLPPGSTSARPAATRTGPDPTTS